MYRNYLVHFVISMFLLLECIHVIFSRVFLRGILCINFGCGCNGQLCAAFSPLILERILNSIFQVLNISTAISFLTAIEILCSSTLRIDVYGEHDRMSVDVRCTVLWAGFSYDPDRGLRRCMPNARCRMKLRVRLWRVSRQAPETNALNHNCHCEGRKLEPHSPLTYYRALDIRLAGGQRWWEREEWRHSVSMSRFPARFFEYFRDMPLCGWRGFWTPNFLVCDFQSSFVLATGLLLDSPSAPHQQLPITFYWYLKTANSRSNIFYILLDEQ